MSAAITTTIIILVVLLLTIYVCYRCKYFQALYISLKGKKGVKKGSYEALSRSDFEEMISGAFDDEDDDDDSNDDFNSGFNMETMEEGTGSSSQTASSSNNVKTKLDFTDINDSPYISGKTDGLRASGSPISDRLRAPTGNGDNLSSRLSPKHNSGERQ